MRLTVSSSFVAAGLAMVFALASPAIAQAPLGAWEMDLSRWERSPVFTGPSPQVSTVRTFQDWGDGLVFINNEGVSAQGNPTGNRIVARRDGRDYPIAARNQIAYVTVAFDVTNVSPWSANYTIKVDGNVTQTATEMISPDGQTMTVMIQGMNADGPYTETQVWVKQ